MIVFISGSSRCGECSYGKNGFSHIRSLFLLATCPFGITGQQHRAVIIRNYIIIAFYFWKKKSTYFYQCYVNIKQFSLL